MLGDHRGRVVQVDSIKPTLEAPGIERFQLKHEELLSHFAFNFNLRRYIVARLPPHVRTDRSVYRNARLYTEAGAYTRSLLGST